MALVASLLDLVSQLSKAKSDTFLFFFSQLYVPFRLKSIQEYKKWSIKMDLPCTYMQKSVKTCVMLLYFLQANHEIPVKISVTLKNYFMTIKLT